MSGFESPGNPYFCNHLQLRGPGLHFPRVNRISGGVFGIPVFRMNTETLVPVDSGIRICDPGLSCDWEREFRVNPEFRFTLWAWSSG